MDPIKLDVTPEVTPEVTVDPTPVDVTPEVIEKVVKVDNTTFNIVKITPAYNKTIPEDVVVDSYNINNIIADLTMQTEVVNEAQAQLDIFQSRYDKAIAAGMKLPVAEVFTPND